MESDLGKVKQLLTQLHADAQFTKDDMFAILQGVTGFLSGAAGDDPFGALGAAIETAEHFATQCNTGTLQDNMANVNKWLTFGQAYQKLEDSSDLDFDKMDVGSVPEMMQVLNNIKNECMTMIYISKKIWGCCQKRCRH